MAYVNGKCCCNCQYWSGTGKVSAFKDKAEVKSIADQGICQNRKATNAKGRPQRADHPNNCGGFEKWDK